MSTLNASCRRLGMLLAAASSIAAIFPAGLGAAAPGDHAWAPLIPIYGDGGLGRNYPMAQIAIDGAGNRMAVWFEVSGTGHLFAAWAPAAGEWTAPVPIDSQVQSGLASFDLAMSENGDAVVAWVSTYNMPSFNRYSVDAAFYRSGAGWGYAQMLTLDDPTLGTSPARVGAPAAGIDDQGRAVVVWTQTVDYLGTNETDVYAAHRSGTWVNWSAPAILDKIPGVPDLVDVACGRSGGLDVAAWRQAEGVNYSLFTSVFEPGNGSWQTPQRQAAGPVNWLSVAPSAPREAVLAWSEGNTGAARVKGAVFKSGAWSANTTLDGAAESHGSLAVGANRGGAAVAVWTVWNTGAGTQTMRASTLNPASGWTASGDLEIEPYAYVTAPGIDAAGNAMFLWMGTVNVYFPVTMARRFVNGTGWEASVFVAGNFDFPEDFAMAPDGRGAGAVRHFDGTHTRPFEARFLQVDQTPPPLVVDQPATPATVRSPVITITGWTEEGAVVYVNGVWAQVGVFGSFGVVVELQEGTQNITVLAGDAAGNVANVTLMITYEPAGAAALEARVAALEAQLNVSLAALNASVAAVEALVNVSGAPGGAVWTSINETRGALAALEANVSALRATVSAQGNASGAEAARLAALETSVVDARADLNETAADAEEAGRVAQSAQTQGGMAAGALVAGIAGAALGALGAVMAMRSGGGGMRVREKGNRTKMAAAPSAGEEVAGAPEGEAADDLRVKEKGSRTK